MSSFMAGVERFELPVMVLETIGLAINRYPCIWGGVPPLSQITWEPFSTVGRTWQAFCSLLIAEWQAP